MKFNTLDKEINECFDEVKALRRDFHRHPEIGRNEFRTSKIIREKLTEYGVDSIESPVPTAVVALIKGQKGDGKCIALRADIDALPVQEESSVAFSSEVPQMMHACNHDMHIAMLLGTAKVLCAKRSEFAGTVKLIFQHSEDTLPGGAKELVELGVMENPHVDAIYGMHVYPDESRVGEFALLTGSITTSVDVYDVTVKGVGGHGSEPHTTKDPILAACQMVTMLQQIPSRYIDPLETVIFPICRIHSGDAVNVIPDSASFAGVARAFSEPVRDVVSEQVTKIANGLSASSGCNIMVNHVKGYPACYNDESLIHLAKEAITEEMGEEAVHMLKKPMFFSEDFSYYTEMTDTPGAYILLYAGHLGKLVSLHNPSCVLEEDAMKAGIAAFVSIVLKSL